MSPRLVTAGRYRETIVTLLAMALVLVFMLLVIPAGIGVGFSVSASPGTPRLVPQLASAGMILALLCGLVAILRHGSAMPPADVQNDSTGESTAAVTWRPAIVSVVCLLVAFWGFAWLGFYAGSALLMVVLKLLLGERRPVHLIIVPLLTVVCIYVLFDLGFQINMPQPMWAATG
jgi:hypothetical protein